MTAHSHARNAPNFQRLLEEVDAGRLSVHTLEAVVLEALADARLAHGSVAHKQQLAADRRHRAPTV
jgi:hypothetical protein